jgi:hypothetical protein
MNLIRQERQRNREARRLKQAWVPKLAQQNGSIKAEQTREGTAIMVKA